MTQDQVLGLVCVPLSALGCLILSLVTAVSIVHIIRHAKGE